MTDKRISPAEAVELILRARDHMQQAIHLTARSLPLEANFHRDRAEDALKWLMDDAIARGL